MTFYTCVIGERKSFLINKIIIKNITLNFNRDVRGGKCIPGCLPIHQLNFPSVKITCGYLDHIFLAFDQEILFYNRSIIFGFWSSSKRLEICGNPGVLSVEWQTHESICPFFGDKCLRSKCDSFFKTL